MQDVTVNNAVNVDKVKRLLRYATPRLTVYGSVDVITRHTANAINRNDGGASNTKT